jgi:4-hydroxy-tetrahydrodipicolinate synthase
MNSDLHGTGVALATPFSENNTIDYNSLLKLLKYVSKSVDYIVVNGTTGESATTTAEEQKELLSFVKNNNTAHLPVVFGIGGNNTAEVVKKLEQYDLSGVSAILSVAPYYNKPSQEGLFQHYTTIAKASPIPVILYNVPGRTGCNIASQTTLRLAENPNIAGVKEASGNLLQAIEISTCEREDFVLISGDDMLTVPLISVGAKGVISVVANALPGHFSAMVKAALDGRFNDAGVLLRQFASINPCFYEEGNPVGIKAALEIMGLGSSKVRLPLVTASKTLKDKIADCLSSFDEKGKPELLSLKK